MSDPGSDQLADRLEGRRPLVSIVVVVYNIPREAPRTLLSLSAAYQRHIAAADYEVIIVDNGSNPPLDPKLFEGLTGNFRFIRLDPAPPSPAYAVNRGLAEARGDVIGVMIDGARIVTPGFVHFGRHGALLYDRAVAATLGWYLGYDFQSWAMRVGYDQLREDALLAQIGWPENGYRLFEIATLDESSVDGWVLPITESNGLFLRREMWTAIGGADERFDYPGGGLLNLDIFRRAMEFSDTELVVLLGEGTFHQLHGGVATNAPVEGFTESLRLWCAQYEAIRGHPYEPPRLVKPTTYLGILPAPALARFVRAAMEPTWGEPRLGPHFDTALWAFAPSNPPTDPTLAAVIELAQNEFRSKRYGAAAAVSRLIRERAPDEPEPQRILSLASASLLGEGPPEDRRARYHFALGEFYRLSGDNAQADHEYQRALTFDPTLQQAAAGLAAVRMQMENLG